MRRAEFYLDLLRKGLTIAEALGHAGERLLHERRRDDLIFPLRQQFPLRNTRDGTSLEIRLFDGLAFTDADVATFPAASRAILTDVKSALDASVTAVAVTTGPDDRAALLAAGADAVFDSLADFPGWMSMTEGAG